MTPDTTTTLLVLVVTTAAFVLGGCISVIAYRAARRRDSKPLRLFSYGFGLLSVGLLAGGLGTLLFRVSPERSLLVQGAFVSVGLLVLLRSLYVAGPVPIRS
jgi:hypothetical protein